jgi:hypothetical protein
MLSSGKVVRNYKGKSPSQRQLKGIGERTLVVGRITFLILMRHSANSEPDAPLEIAFRDTPLQK